MENDIVATPRFFAPIVAIALSACSMQQTPAIPAGTTQSPPTVAQTPATTPSASVGVRPDALTTDDACDGNGGIRATPCNIAFTAANSEAAAVTLTTPSGEKGSLAEQDDCSKSGVAAISRQAADQWLVTAGSKHGTCTVHFTYSATGSDVGQAVLHVQNAPMPLGEPHPVHVVY